MQYALVIFTDPDAEASLSPPERDAVVAEYVALLDDPQCIYAAQLEPVETATTVRAAGGRAMMTDGPFADTKEVLGGLCLIEAADLDDAIEFAARIPNARLGGAVEVRPVVQR